MRSCLRLPSFAALTALLIVTAGAGAASAATKKYLPLDFVPTDAATNVIRSPIGVGCGMAAASFAAPLGLPAGATITGIRFYSNGTASRAALVMGYPSIAPPAFVSSSDSVTSLDTPALTTGTLPGGPYAISPDILYSLILTCNPGAAIWSVEVDYTP